MLTLSWAHDAIEAESHQKDAEYCQSAAAVGSDEDEPATQSAEDEMIPKTMLMMPRMTQHATERSKRSQ